MPQLFEIPGGRKPVYPRGPDPARLAALTILHASGRHAQRGRKQGNAQVTVPAQTAVLIDHLRVAGVTLIYDPDKRALRMGTEESVAANVG